MHSARHLEKPSPISVERPTSGQHPPSPFFRIPGAALFIALRYLHYPLAGPSQVCGRAGLARPASQIDTEVGQGRQGVVGPEFTPSTALPTVPSLAPRPCLLVSPCAASCPGQLKRQRYLQNDGTGVELTDWRNIWLGRRRRVAGRGAAAGDAAAKRRHARSMFATEAGRAARAVRDRVAVGTFSE